MAMSPAEERARRNAAALSGRAGQLGRARQAERLMLEMPSYPDAATELRNSMPARPAVDELRNSMPAGPNIAQERRNAAPRQRPVARARSRELSADELNDMVLARLAGTAAPANESAARRSARSNIANAMPAFKKGGLVGAKPKPAKAKAPAFKKGGPIKSAKRK